MVPSGRFTQRKESRPELSGRKKRPEGTTYYRKGNNSLSKDSHRADTATAEPRGRKAESLEP